MRGDFLGIAPTLLDQTLRKINPQTLQIGHGRASGALLESADEISRTHANFSCHVLKNNAQ